MCKQRSYRDKKAKRNADLIKAADSAFLLHTGFDLDSTEESSQVFLADAIDPEDYEELYKSLRNYLGKDCNQKDLVKVQIVGHEGQVSVRTQCGLHQQRSDRVYRGCKEPTPTCSRTPMLSHCSLPPVGGHRPH